MTKDIAVKTRKCLRCKTPKEAREFVRTKSKFHPGGHSLYCRQCLEDMVNPQDIGAVDALMRYLDLPFAIDEWIKLNGVYGEHTLSAYCDFIGDSDVYQAQDYKALNTQWREAMLLGTAAEKIEPIERAKIEKMKRRWPGVEGRTVDDYMYLDELYDGMKRTQNIVTAIQEAQAKQFCESMLNATKEIRAGRDGKDAMKVCHDIMKANGFEPKNAKNLCDFDSVGKILLTLNLFNCWETLRAKRKIFWIG